jgi:glycosyltransferase involved in cell wall biosynthesis
VRVAAVVPAFHEAPRVGAVVRVLRATPGIDAVVVVDDGSRDGTADAARMEGAHVVALPQNVGKGGAMLAGVRAVPWADAVVFVDADLSGLTSAHVDALATPLRTGTAEMAVGRLDGWSDAKALRLGGQRAALRSIPLRAPDLGAAGYGAEVALTRQARAAGGRTVLVPLPGVASAYKVRKYGLSGAFALGTRMRWDVARASGGGLWPLWAALAVAAGVAGAEAWS